MRMIADFSGVIKFKNLKTIFMTDISKAAASANIPYAVVQDLHQLYLNRKHKFLSTDLQTKEETKSIWFELNPEMRDFLTEVLNDKVVSGIRVYLMAYPAEQTIMHSVTIPADPADVNQLTIGLVTTKAAGGKHPDYPETGSGFKMLLAPPMNHGELCPTKCN